MFHRRSQDSAKTRPSPARAFTLLELLIVVLILGILAAIVMPSFTSASAQGEEAAVRANLRILRTAMERYRLQHKGSYPTSLTALDRYTSDAGAMSSNKTAVYKFGPYVRKIPRCPTGPNKGATGWGAANANPPTVVNNLPTVGWLYHWQTGGVWVNDINHLDK